MKDRYPAYIDWSTCEKICTTIRDNRAEYMRIKTRGAPRDGELLLHGIDWCGPCGHKRFVRYKGGGQYVCNRLRSNEGLPTCQEMRAARIDKAVADSFLTALAPAELDAPNFRWTPHCARAPNANSSEYGMPPLWPSVQSGGPR
ncbi:MAG TPA: hypothetical protein VFE60_08205 [Roseiarcus sp.]|nr:hypothetical protein [Roseiarcus sp.]